MTASPPTTDGATWGSSRMSAFETMMWRGEVDPRLRSTGTIVHLLDRAPDWDRLLAAHERATRLVPRLRERVVEPALPIASPGWSQDEKFDLAYHVRRVAVPSPGTFRQLLDVAGAFGQTPLDRARPQWEALLVEGLEDGRAAYIFKLHHSLTDGHGFVQLLSMTLSGTRDRDDDRTEQWAPVRDQQTPIGLLGSEIWEASTGAARSVLSSLGRTGSALRDPLGTLSDGVDFGRSLRRVMGPAEVPRSPLLSSGSGLGWRFVGHDVPLADLKAAAKEAGGSLNDAFIAGLLGALRRYHEEFGVPVDRIPLGMPVSLRTEDDPMGGNRFAAAKFAAPAGEPDPAERIRRIREFVLDAKAEPAITALDAVSPMLSRLPTAAIVKLTTDFAGTLDVQASNIPGLTRPAYLSGARVTRIYPFGPLPGCAVMVALMSHEGTCCIGANVDPDAITDIALFARCLQEGFDEVLALCPAPDTRHREGEPT